MAKHFDSSRYTKMTYRRAGTSGLLLPAVSLGLWHNFGEIDDFKKARKIVRLAFDNGITHFDLANNYGPPPGSAESTFGKIFWKDFTDYRDELVISTKAGWPMWDGPYGDGGSKKYLVASLDQSLKRMGLDYVDIFYHHRPDASTPLEETVRALDLIVKQGKALYIGVSGYSPEETKKAHEMFGSLGTPFIIHQPRYSMFDRSIEHGLLSTLESHELGCIVFSPLAQGLLSNKYLNGIPAGSRAASNRGNGALEEDAVTPEKIARAVRLNQVAAKRNQSLAQLALSWILRDQRITSVLLGVSKPEQLMDSIACLQNISFSDEELEEIDRILV